jgi:multiple sugar transport system substrate-binding protein
MDGPFAGQQRPLASEASGAMVARNQDRRSSRVAIQGRRTLMTGVTRRSLLLRISAGLAATAAGAGTLARPYLANAQAKTATVWHVQGFIPQEDEAFRKVVADYEKTSGNKIDYAIVPFAPLRQKIISAITSGVVPDLATVTPTEAAALQAWQGNLLDVDDVVETQKSRMLPAVLATAYCYNNAEKRRAYYFAPIAGAVVPFHVWGSLVEKAGYKRSDIPKTWDAFIDFFLPVQKKLQAQGMRHTYATGFVVSTIGNDPNGTFAQFLIAYGGQNIVTPDGKFHGDDKQIQEAVARMLARFATLYTDGYIPPSSVNWNDADDNNSFHSKLCVMDFDGTLSTELAMLGTPDGKEAYYHDVMTIPPPLTNDGKQMTSQFFAGGVMIPKGAQNVAVAKDFAKYWMQPEVNREWLKGGLGRSLPIYPELVNNDPWWTDPRQDPHRPPYAKQGFDSPTVPDWYSYNPAWAQVRSEHTLNVAFHDIVADKMPVRDAAAKALKRIAEIFAAHRIAA